MKSDSAKMYSIEFFLAKRKDNFLLLRIIAAVMVIYGHSFALTRNTYPGDVFVQSGWRTYSGDMAVAIFFVVSGFMVSGSYVSRGSLFSYLSARLLRIAPGFMFVLVFTVCVIGPLFTSLSFAEYIQFPQLYSYVTQNLEFSSNMLFTLPGVFATHKLSAVNGSLWTLPAEMRMYMLVAVLGVFGCIAHRVAGTVIIVALFIAALSNPRLLPMHADWLRPAGYFCVGIVAQLYKERITIRHDAMLALVFLTYISYLTDSYPWIFGLTLSYFCFWFAYRTPHLGTRFGDPSYGIYLWGFVAQQVVIACFPALGPHGNFLISACIAIVMGLLSWHLVESPALSLKDKVISAYNAARARRKRNDSMETTL